MIRTDLKPLSINDAYTGRRYKTSNYESFVRSLTYLLPAHFDVPEGKLEITMKFGQSSSNCDWDNPIKTFQDVLAKKYGFNDKRIFKGAAEKVIVPKGQEFIEWELKGFSTV